MTSPRPLEMLEDMAMANRVVRSSQFANSTLDVDSFCTMPGGNKTRRPDHMHVSLGKSFEATFTHSHTIPSLVAGSQQEART